MKTDEITHKKKCFLLREALFLCVINRGLLCNLNSSAAVEGDRRQSLYTTLADCGNLAVLNAHLDEFVGNRVGTTLRKLLVVSRSTCRAVSITCNEEAVVVVLCILCKSLYVYEILLRSDGRLVDVEEDGNRCVDQLLDRL